MPSVVAAVGWVGNWLAVASTEGWGFAAERGEGQARSAWAGRCRALKKCSDRL